jgi:hypothetical protein
MNILHVIVMILFCAGVGFLVWDFIFFIIENLKPGITDVVEEEDDDKCTNHFELNVTPPPGVVYKWQRLYKGGESYGGDVELDEDRVKEAFGGGWVPVPYERHKDVTETLDVKKLSIQLSGFILVEKHLLTEIEQGINLKDAKSEISYDDGIIDGEVINDDKLVSEYLDRGNSRLLNEFIEGQTIKSPDYKKVIEKAIENKEDDIRISGESEGFSFKLQIKSEKE